MADKQPPQRPGPGSDSGWVAVGMLLSGIIVWGFVGGVLDVWLGLPKHIGLLVGMIAGIAGALYLVMKRFG